MKNEETLDLLLRKVCKAHTNKVNKVLEEYGLHKGQPILLRLLVKEDGVPQSILAREMEVTPATASAMVKRLEKAGYVVRRRDAEDERVSNVYLTDAGREISSSLIDVQNRMNEMVFGDFSEKEKTAMRDYLQRVLENLSG